MKQSPDMNRIQQNMKRGVITVHGFLGCDGRDLIQILEEDEMEVRKMNLTHQEIAAKMKEFRDAGAAGLGEFIEAAPHFLVKVDSVRGKLRCPFGDPGLIPKTNITVRNLELDREITFTDMSIHCIGEHGFYQGKGALFRLNPGDLAEILELR